MKASLGHGKLVLNEYFDSVVFCWEKEYPALFHILRLQPGQAYT